MTETPLQDRQSPLLDIVRAHATGEADWPATKAALLDFDWKPDGDPEQPPIGSAEWYDWYLDVAEGSPIPAPGSWRELVLAQDVGLISADKVHEVLGELVTRSAT